VCLQALVACVWFAVLMTAYLESWLASRDPTCCSDGGIVFCVGHYLPCLLFVLCLASPPSLSQKVFLDTVWLWHISSLQLFFPGLGRVYVVMLWAATAQRGMNLVGVHFC
jgi:hypothetical protein